MQLARLAFLHWLGARELISNYSSSVLTAHGTKLMLSGCSRKFWTQGAHIQSHEEASDGAWHKLMLSDAVAMLRTREVQRAQHQAVIK